MLITPFILGGAMGPATVAGTATQTLAEALAGMAFCQLVRPGAPVDLRLVRVVDVDAVRRADVRHARAGAGALRDGRARAPARRPVPLRRRPHAPRRSPTPRPPTSRANTLQPTMLGGVNFVLHTAGWLEGGLAMGYEKFILDVDQAARGTRSRRASTCRRTARRSTRC